MPSTFSREIPFKTFKERIELSSIIYFFVILFLNLIGLSLPDLKPIYIVFFSLCIIIAWVFQVFLAKKVWFNKIEINENGMNLFGFEFNHSIVRKVPFENFSINVEFNKPRYINPDYYQLRLKSNNQYYIFNSNNEWNEKLMYDILKELNIWRDLSPFMIDGIHYLSDFEQRAKNIKS